MGVKGQSVVGIGDMLFPTTHSLTIRPLHVHSIWFVIDLGCSWVGVPEKLLQEINRHSVIRKVLGYRVAKKMRVHVLRDAGVLGELLYSIVRAGFGDDLASERKRS